MQFISLFVDCRHVVTLIGDGHEHNLGLGNSWRKHKTLVVTVNHNHRANRPSRETPRGLPDKLLFALFVLELHIEHLCKVLTKLVRSSSLDSSTICWNEKFDSCRVVRSSKLLSIRFTTLDWRHSQQIFITRCVLIQYCENHMICFLCCRVCGMTLLPQEFSCSNERSGMFKFPSNYIRPLIQTKRQITMRMNPFRIAGIHNGLACWSNSNRFRKISVAWSSHPCYLRCESLHMILLFTKSSLWHEHWEIAVLNAISLEAWIEEALDTFPDKVC